MTDRNYRIEALAKHLQCEQDELTESKHDEKTIEYGNQEYLVVTDSEADELWEESLDNYIDECITPELPEVFRCYFDNEGWKRDARMDGRAHSLSSYDGEENEETIDGDTYYIYRIN